jgi:hypothetical protein
LAKDFGIILKLLTIAFIAINAMSIFAQTQKFDIMTYTPPKGWKAEANENAKIYTKIDKATNSLGIIMLYPSIDSSGDANDDFKYVWKQIVQNGFGASANPETETAQDKGFTVINGGELIKYEGIQALAMLTVLSGKGKVISILTITNEQSYASATENLLDSLTINATDSPKSATKQEPITSTKQSSTLKINPNVNTQNSIEGVWMTSVPDTLRTSFTQDIKYRVFFNDGRSLSSLPNGGLLNYSPQTDQSAGKGKYTYANGKGINQTTDNSSSRETLTLISPTRMKIDNRIFYKCASVNGLSLNGKITTVNDWKNTDFSNWDEGKKPILELSASGKFIDRGFFTTLMYSSNDPDFDKAGNGTYSIRDFTLSLQFADGRVKELGFNLFWDSKILSEIIYLERSGLQVIK